MTAQTVCPYCGGEMFALRAIPAAEPPPDDGVGDWYNLCVGDKWNPGCNQWSLYLDGAGDVESQQLPIANPSVEPDPWQP